MKPRNYLIVALILLLAGCAGVEYRCGAAVDRHGIHWDQVGCGADNQGRHK